MYRKNKNKKKDLEFNTFLSLKNEKKTAGCTKQQSALRKLTTLPQRENGGILLRNVGNNQFTHNTNIQKHD